MDWFAAQQQASKFRCTKHGLFYSKCNAKFNELTPTIMHKIFETSSNFHVKYGKSSISIFQGFFARMDQISILAGRLETRLIP